MIQRDELKNLNGAQIKERLKREPSVYLSKYFVEKEKRLKENLEGMRSLINEMKEAFEDFADGDVKKNLEELSDVLKVLETVEEYYRNAEGKEAKGLYWGIYINAYNKFKLICNKYRLSMDVRNELFRSKNALNRRLITEARNNVKNLSRQINKVSESLKKRTLQNEDRSKLSGLEKKIEETCKKEKIIIGPIRRVWEAFKSSPIGRLFGLKTYEEKECDKLMEKLIEHSKLGPNYKLILEQTIEGIGQRIEELSKLSLADEKRCEIIHCEIIDSCEQLKKIITELRSNIRSYSLSDEDRNRLRTARLSLNKIIENANSKAISVSFVKAVSPAPQKEKYGTTSGKVYRVLGDAKVVLKKYPAGNLTEMTQEPMQRLLCGT